MLPLKPTATKGRGALSNATGRYEQRTKVEIDDGWHTETDQPTPTQWRDENAKSIILAFSSDWYVGGLGMSGRAFLFLNQIEL